MEEHDRTPANNPYCRNCLDNGSMFCVCESRAKAIDLSSQSTDKRRNNWAKVTLLALNEYSIGWAKQVNELLETWDLEKDWSVIKQKPFREWKRQIDAAAEKRNIEKLKEECEIKSRGEKTLKKKTIFVLEMY